MSNTITVTVNTAVDRYHKRGLAMDVPNDEYHKGLIKAGYLQPVEEVKPKVEPKPKAEATPKLDAEEA